MIQPSEARNLLTKSSIAKYVEKTTVPTFFRSFFKVKEVMTKFLSIEVQRGTEKVAVDVIRGGDGNANKLTKSTEKTFMPPLYWEWLAANDHDLYDVAMAQLNPSTLNDLSDGLASDLMKLRQKIERAIELQCSQVFLSGIVQLKKGTDIDYKRKAASVVDSGGAGYWTASNFDPRKTIKKAGDFLRSEGKIGVGTLNVIMGDNAYEAFEDSTFIKEKADLKDYDITNIFEPQRNSSGGVLQGRLSAGAYKVNVWTYPEVYTNEAGVTTKYMDPDSIVVLPETTNFELGFAAVPQLIKGRIAPQRGAYLISEFVDERAVEHEMHIKSAPLAIPVAIDTIFTEKVA
tara:strand:+ start:2076 stop:3110 length:1035 start_codon:yes stop_codon:yes gene_type:complete